MSIAGRGTIKAKLLNYQGNAQGVHRESIFALAFDYLVRAENFIWPESFTTTRGNMMGRRIHTGVLNSLEATLIGYLLPKVPRSITPNQLSAFAASGAVAAGLGLGACQFSPWFLTVVLLGLFANWLGDSFDGAVARRNKAERPRVGFLIDRCCDVLSFCAIILGLGLSPYLSLHLALMLLVGYLVNTIYGLMKLVVDGVHIIGVGGIGATEGRVIIGLWAVFDSDAACELANLPDRQYSAVRRCLRRFARDDVRHFCATSRQGHREGELFGSPVDADRREVCCQSENRPVRGARLNFDRHMKIDERKR